MPLRLSLRDGNRWLTGGFHPIIICVMIPRLLDKIFRRCSHQFSWPRKAYDGTYYQVCLRCSAQYAYDWEVMRRTYRIEARPARFDPSKPERRMNVAMKVRYRKVGTEVWHRAITENMSQTGVKLRGSPVLPEGTPVEIVLEMPESITGQPGSKIICNGRVARVVESSVKESAPGFAVRLRDYRFLSIEPVPRLEAEPALR